MQQIIKKIKTAFVSCLSLFMVGGCDYLDVDPELGLTSEEVFETYNNLRDYFDWLYESNAGKNMERIHISFPFYYDLFRLHKFSWYMATDAADCGLLEVAQQNFKQGMLTQDLIERLTFSTAQADNKPICKAMFAVIRRCNVVIQNIDMCKNATEEQYNDILGEAHFLRGYAHFTLCRQFGGVPYISHTLEAGMEWDIPRVEPVETMLAAAEDFETAYQYFKANNTMRRNTATDLSSKRLLSPAGCAALALKARALLYAASPLYNTSGDPQSWRTAADACAEALMVAQEQGFELLPLAKFKQNFVGMEMTNETIWGYSLSQAQNNQNFMSLYSHCQSNRTGGAGSHPTQNFVDRFETLDGYPLYTEADRQKAIAAGSYADQNPYANRDPRFDFYCVHDGSTRDYVAGLASGKTVSIHRTKTGTWPKTSISSSNRTFAIEWGSKDREQNGFSNTGYYHNKYWTGFLGSKNTPSSTWHIDPLVRLADLYLMYAEAVNEAYGPKGTAGGCFLTAVEAVNTIRGRVGVAPVHEEFTTSKESFRERVRNERCVELAYEGHHYYYDIRRWKTAPELCSATLYGMFVEEVTKSATYPVGRKYERRALPSNRQQTWKDYMYWFPFPDTEMFKMRNFTNNPWQ